MSEQDVEQVGEEGAAEAAELPDVAVPGEGTPEPDEPEADEPGPSDDEAAGGEETSDGDEATESGETDEPGLGEPDTEARLDEITRALGKAARSYGNRVAAIFGDDWMGCVPCPLCTTDFPGILTPAPRSEESIAAVRPIIGLPDLSTYREDRYARTCERCDGRGKTLTGSRVPQYATMTCPECKGAGFRSAEEGRVQVAAPNGSEAPPQPTHAEEEPVAAMPEAAMVALEQMLAAARNAGVAQ